VPRAAGWLSHERADEFLRLGPGHLRYDREFRRDARVFEGSAQNVLGFAALDAAVELISSLGVERIFSHVQAYHDRLENALLPLGLGSLRSPRSERRSGSLSFRVPAELDPVALHRALGEHGIACGLPDGLLRFSPHWPNDVSEVEGIAERVGLALADSRVTASR
jgi:selenocysteine lyase/cysteine desulfurase